MKPKTICTIPIDYVHRSVRLDKDSDFTTFLRSFLPGDKVDALILEYQIGVTHSGDVLFFELDGTLQCRGGKIMKFDPVTGHRITDESQPHRINWIHPALKWSGNLPSSWEMTQCLFGEHLLKKYPDKPVALVEAEKTAIICAAFMPEYVWLATGGKSQLNDRVKVLKGRKVVAYPDLDALNDWRERSLRYPEINITVSSLLEKVASPQAIEAKMDIADWLVEWAIEARKA